MLFQFKIQIKRITKPPIWRRVFVLAQFTLDRFHLVIQNAFRWTNSHLYEFFENDFGARKAYGLHDDVWGENTGTKDSRKVNLSSLFKNKGEEFLYVYDFGDDWIHQITLEEITNEEKTKAEHLSGSGACPPEDCGGVFRYEQLKKVLLIRTIPIIRTTCNGIP